MSGGGPDVEQVVRERVRPPALPARRLRVRGPGRRGVAGLRAGVYERWNRGAAERRERRYRVALLVADLVAAAAAVLLGLGLADEGLRAGAVLVPLLVAVLHAAGGLYARDEARMRKTTLEDAPAVFHVATLCALLTWLGSPLVVEGHLHAAPVAALWLLLAGGVLVARSTARRLVRGVVAVERVLVLGGPEAAARVEAKLERDDRVRAQVVAHLVLPPRADARTHDAVVERLEALVIEHRADRVLVAPGSADVDLVDVVRAAKALGARVSVVPRLFEVVGTAVEFDHLDEMVVLGVRRFGLTNTQRAAKRAFDLAVAVPLALLTGPLFAVLALAVRLDSPGPALFRQVRVGQDGRHFTMLKFRTMVMGAEAQREALAARNESEGLFKLRDDPRVTRVGRVLRRAHLDELPQLVNVLRGQMSVVGPRPLVVEEDRRVEGFHRRRLHLKPGMTGRWQLLGPTRIPLGEMLTIDLLYVSTWSLWEDLRILVRTVPRVVGRRGL